MTNFICSILLTVTTNTAEHWPDKQVPNPPAAIGYTGPIVQVQDGKFYGYHFEPDTNADDKSVEYSVTAQKLLAEEHDLVNLFHKWLAQPGPEITGKAAIGLKLPNSAVTNELVDHWQVDYKRIRTNQWFKIGHTFDPPWGFSALSFKTVDDGGGISSIHALLATNYFIPVATNRLHPIVSWINSSHGPYQETNYVTVQDIRWVLENGTDKQKTAVIEKATGWKLGEDGMFH